MACCRKRKLLPIAILCPLFVNGNIEGIEECSIWNDPHCPTFERQIVWRFFKNDLVIYQTDFQSLSTNLNVGSTSNYGFLRLPNGANDLFDFLENLGFTFEHREQLSLQIQINNRCGLLSAFSEAIHFTKTHCSFPWLTMAGEHFETLSNQCWQYEIPQDDP